MQRTNLFNGTPLDKYIEENKYVEAWGKLKNKFIEKKVNDKDLENIIQIVMLGLKNDDLTFAVNVAIHTIGWYMNDPIATMWDQVLQKANKSGGLPKLEIETVFLNLKDCNNPDDLFYIAKEIWEIFKNKNWDIPEYTIRFGAFGRGPNSKPSDIEKPILITQVTQITGKDFILGFSGYQGKAAFNLCDTGGFDFIAVDNFALQFYSDGSGPSIYRYIGNDWANEIKNITPEDLDYSSSWQEVDCRNHGLDDAAVRTKIIHDLREHYTNAAIKYLTDKALPELKHICSNLHEPARLGSP